jgi:hypothetical protein
MLDRLKAKVQVPTRPNKIRIPAVKPEDFKRFRPRVIYDKPKPNAVVISPRASKSNITPNIGLRQVYPIKVVQKGPQKGPPPKPPVRNQVRAVSAKNHPKSIITPKPSPDQITELRRLALERAKTVKVVKAPRNPIKTQISASVLGNRTQILRNVGVGRILIMIAAGPSVLEVDFSPLVNQPLIDFMCINQPNTQVWPAKYWAFCDHTQYKRNVAVWDSYNGIIINSYNVTARKGNQVLIRNRAGKGFSLDITSGYHIGRSSTYAAMQVAYFMNFKRVYIFGVDMCEVGGKLHYYGQNPDVTNEIRKQRFANEAENYLWAGQHLQSEIRERFYFCSTYLNWPFVSYFNKLDHHEANTHILDYINGLPK